LIHAIYSATVNKIEKGLVLNSGLAVLMTPLQIKDKRARVLEAVVALKQSASKSNSMDFA
jgi:hypothetical protein